MVNAEEGTNHCGGRGSPHVKLVVDKAALFGNYGWASTGSVPFGSISRVPVWGDSRLTYLFGVITTNPYTSCGFSGKIPEGGISIRRLDTGYEIKTEGSVESSKDPGTLFTKADKDKTVPLVFDPPPYRISIRKSSRYLPALERRAGSALRRFPKKGLHLRRQQIDIDRFAF